MKVTKCENRFEVVLDGMVTEDEAAAIDAEFLAWLTEKTEPTDEDYMAALGPCGK
jgi:hypothetical protein